MGSREPKPRFVLVLIIAVTFLASLMFQEIAATSRLRSKGECSSSIACHLRAALRLQNKHDLEMEDYDHDSYRKYGNVPSPGAGH
ncbi:hypothetical protein L6164_029813 [Bauhinia variegata]|uniref:Uncharacterized protein n=1 Tax=Bauhinia variegata TaxID=167791 RepID=A0ACB9LAI0_BAUVA|nr:hypothetical protein L6164_029813 [Bauhinia variegata]